MNNNTRLFLSLLSSSSFVFLRFYLLRTATWEKERDLEVLVFLFSTIRSVCFLLIWMRRLVLNARYANRVPSSRCEVSLRRLDMRTVVVFVWTRKNACFISFSSSCLLEEIVFKLNDGAGQVLRGCEKIPALVCFLMS